MRRPLLVLIVLLLLVVNAWADEARPKPKTAKDYFPLEAMAQEPYQPDWAPLPVLRGDDGGLDVLHRLLKSPDPIARARSAFLVGQVGSPESVSVLVAHLRDPNRNVRLQSGLALACMGDARGIPECSKLLKSGPPWLRYYAVFGLWRVDRPEARQILKTYASDRDKFISDTIKDALKTKFVAPPPVAKRPPGAPAPEVPTSQTWSEAVAVYMGESDYWWHIGNYSQAIRCLEAQIFFNPAFIDAYSNAAWLQWSMGDKKSAIVTLKQAVAANPKNPDAYFEQGFHYFRMKDYRHAEAPLRRSVELGGDVFSKRVYAHTLERIGKPREAVKLWEKMVRADPKDETAKRNLKQAKKLVK